MFYLSMMINNYSYTPFTGRASIIKDADKICRIVNSDFPHLSPYLSWHQYHQPYTHYQAFIPYWSKLDDLREATKATDTAYDYYDVLIKKLKNNKCANCGELSDIVYLKCKNKNFEDVKCVQLGGISPVYKKRKEKYDHIAVMFRHKGKDIVIDPLFGFADFLPNALVKYKTIFKHLISGFNENFDLNLFDSWTVKIHPYDLKELTKKYEHLIG